MLKKYLTGEMLKGLSSDELLNTQGEVRIHWKKLLSEYDALGPDALSSRHEEVQRLLRENGVTYNVYGDASASNRAWDLDPIPMVFDKSDWSTIEEGLLQRVELLNAILLNLYGSRSLLRKNFIPFELIYNHQGFLRQADKIRLPSEEQLIHYSADLARGPNGQMWILNDRTDAPSGAGYVLENRAALTRVFPQLIRKHQVRKIHSYYRTMRDTLSDLSPTDKDRPRIVLLSPGEANETYFEHAYISSFLGYTLAFGQDLTVRDGYVWLRTLKGLEKVDVILRRVDDVYCDPLEFKGDSHLGVVGLMESIRQKKVAMVNPMGCRILENPGLMAFLPALCKEILGQDLKLPSVATWWCGQPREKRYVLDNLHKLIIKNIYRDHRNRSIYGNELTKSQLHQLAMKIEAHPYLYVGQEMVSFSTTPSLQNREIVPKNALFRSYVVADTIRGGYQVMPGGLARTSIQAGVFKVSNQTGGVSKDAWVLGGEPRNEWEDTTPSPNIQPLRTVMPSRTGESLFWLGRYFERSVYAVRLLRIIINKYNESDNDIENDVELNTLFRSLTFLTGTFPGFVGKGEKEDAEEEESVDPEKELISVASNEMRIGSLAQSLSRMLHNSYTVRDRLSVDTWRILDGITEDLESLKQNQSLHIILDELDQLLIKLMAFNGLNIDNMSRGSTWRLLNIGRYVESALSSISLMRSMLIQKQPHNIERTFLEVLLQCNDSIFTYRYRYRSRFTIEGVLKLLLRVGEAPRSIIYFINNLEELINSLPKSEQHTLIPKIKKQLLEAKMHVQLSELEDLVNAEEDDFVRISLDNMLSKLHVLITESANLFTQNYFSHTQDIYRFITPPRLPDI